MKTIEEVKNYLENELKYVERMSMKYWTSREKAQFVNEKYLADIAKENYYNGQVDVIKKLLRELNTL